MLNKCVTDLLIVEKLRNYRLTEWRFVWTHKRLRL